MTEEDRKRQEIVSVGGQHGFFLNGVDFVLRVVSLPVVVLLRRYGTLGRATAGPGVVIGFVVMLWLLVAYGGLVEWLYPSRLIGSQLKLFALCSGVAVLLNVCEIHARGWRSDDIPSNSSGLPHRGIYGQLFLSEEIVKDDERILRFVEPTLVFVGSVLAGCIGDVGLSTYLLAAAVAMAVRANWAFVSEHWLVIGRRDTFFHERRRVGLLTGAAEPASTTEDVVVPATIPSEPLPREPRNGSSRRRPRAFETLTGPAADILDLAALAGIYGEPAPKEVVRFRCPNPRCGVRLKAGPKFEPGTPCPKCRTPIHDQRSDER